MLTSALARRDAAPRSWLVSLREAIRDPYELCRVLDLPGSMADRAVAGSDGFSLLAPREYVAQMRPGDPHDPLLRQVMPLPAEQTQTPGYSQDPVGDGQSEQAPGMLKKYGGRALLIVTGACAVHCRYCFRRHYAYAEGPQSSEAWQPALKRIAADTSLDEVILSGGDPLMLSDGRLATLAGRLGGIGHLRRLRVHTRLPVMIPARICDTLLDWLARGPLTPIVVIHVNHPAELSGDVASALARLSSAGVMLLNQAVLLRGVNDRVETLVELARGLVDLRVWPYYLHQFDRVQGAAHFEVPLAEGLKIVDEVRRQLPGYAAMRYVQEIPGEPYKTLLA